VRESTRFGGEFLEPFGTASPSTAFGLYFVFGIGVLGQPHMVHKFFMLSDPHRIRHLPWVLGGSQVVCLLVWIGVGLAVPALVAQGALEPLLRADDAAPVFLLHYASDTVAGLFLAGVLAAIMSTADSLLNIGSAAIVRDLPRALGRPVRDELLWARCATVLVGLAAAAIGLAYDDLIALLGTLAFGTFGAALAPCLAVGLLWERVPAAAASASIATGLVASVVLELAARPGGPALLAALEVPPGVPPAAVSLALSFSVLFLVTLVRRRSEPASRDPELIAMIAGAAPRVAARPGMG
jgi:Na+/proline symporter